MTSNKATAAVLPRRPLVGRFLKNLRKYWQYYILLLPALAYFLIFCYGPMYGAQIAFRNFNARDGITGSAWVGFAHFERFFRSPYFGSLLRNTFVISIYALLAGFPLPILLALSLNELKGTKVKKLAQTVTYAPYFISTVVMCGMIILFLSPSTGVIAKLLSFVGVKLPNLMGLPGAFSSIYVWTEAWQHVGWDSILYIAALSAVDPTLYEAATVDGASKWQKILRIDIPMLMPTVTIMLILRMGSVMSVGFEKVYLLQNSLNMTASEIISTYVYKMGLISNQYSLSSAINLFNNVINFILLLSMNWISGKLSETSLI